MPSLALRQSTCKQYFIIPMTPKLFALQNCSSGDNIIFRLLKLLQLTKIWKLLKLNNILGCASGRTKLKVGRRGRMSGLNARVIEYSSIRAVGRCANDFLIQESGGCLRDKRCGDAGSQVHACIMPPGALPRLRVLEGPHVRTGKVCCNNEEYTYCFFLLRAEEQTEKIWLVLIKAHCRMAREGLLHVGSAVKHLRDMAENL